jgi:hypothetical protein
MRVQPPAGAPGWALALTEAINRSLGELAWPRVKTVADAASAPPPAGNAGRVIFVRNIARIAVCDGAAWIRQDTGGIL